MTNRIALAATIAQIVTDAKGEITRDAQEEISAALMNEYGCSEIINCGESQYAQGIGCDWPTLSSTADVAAATYLKSQGYDVEPTDTYDAIWDRLGNDAEEVYQTVWCAVAEDSGDVQVRQ